jgi:hypothetical protein
MDNNWLNQIELPLSKSEKTQYQILMTLGNIERLLNQLLPKEDRQGVEECTITEISSVDYSDMTKEQLIIECEKQGLKISARDSRVKLLEKLAE